MNFELFDSAEGIQRVETFGTSWCGPGRSKRTRSKTEHSKIGPPMIHRYRSHCRDFPSFFGPYSGTIPIVAASLVLQPPSAICGVETLEAC